MAGKLTPLMHQYWDIKNLHEDKILFFRMGDFYEIFHSDAVTVAPILGIALTSRNKNSVEETPMCGMPHHSAGQYINKLLANNFKVAICDQIEDPKLAKGLVKRAVTRILSPGMVFDPETLDQQNTNYLCSYDDSSVSFLESSTGEAFYYKVSAKEMFKLINIMNPIELVLTSQQKHDILNNKKELMGPHLTIFENEFETPGLIQSARRLLDYAQYMQGAEILNTIQEFEERKLSKRLELSQNVIRHLEIFKSYRGEQKGSFFTAIDRTKTAAGARKLKNWIMFPLSDLKLITTRQNEVEKWYKKPLELKDIRKLLGSMGDIERRLGKISNPTCNARDLNSLAQSVEVGLELSQLAHMPIDQNFKKAHELVLKLKKTIVDEPPASTKEGHLIRTGVAPELDELIRLATDSNTEMLALETREKENTGISSLKVRYNSVFGYYIEITNTHAAKAPAHYMRKQTLANAERFITNELQELESKVLSAKSKRCDLEFEIFETLRKHVLGEAGNLIKLAHTWSELDVYSSLAWLAMEQSYSRPKFHLTDNLILKGSRHPVVEQLVAQTFVPNDIMIQPQGCLLLTGPNMAGKSTLMRQVALSIIMAQIGSYIPARDSSLPIFEKVFTRIGASDFLSEGLSTFMVEMTETAEILSQANSKSLVVLDEIGRGTSTYDGMSLAQAILEYLVQNVKAMTLFATHYHELTNLDAQHPTQIENFHMEISERAGQIEFLHTLVRGPANKSYGIEVAKKAGLPSSVIKKAQNILKGREYLPQAQLDFTETPSTISSEVESMILDLKSSSVNQMTPLDALRKIVEWQKSLI